MNHYFVLKKNMGRALGMHTAISTIKRNRKMIDIPFGKALVPVEAIEEMSCKGCFFNDIDAVIQRENGGCSTLCVNIICDSHIFKLVDYPEEGENVEKET
jgi:hypothetical protein